MYGKTDRVYAVIVAAGSGTRMGSGTKKQFLPLDGKPLLYYSIAACAASDIIDGIVIVTAEEDVAYCREAVVEACDLKKVMGIVPGGNTRAGSVFEGLKALPGNDEDFFSKDVTTKGSDFVIIHDGARPFLTDELIRRCVDGAAAHGACVAAIPVGDTIKVADADGFVTDTLSRSSLRAMQTPQAFRYPLIRHAYTLFFRESDAAEHEGMTDDAMVVERYCPDTKVFLAEGDYRNRKITTQTDLMIAGIILHT